MGVRQSSIGWILGRVWLFDEGGMEGEREGGREGEREREGEIGSSEGGKIGSLGGKEDGVIRGWMDGIGVYESVFIPYFHTLFLSLYTCMVNWLIFYEIFMFYNYVH